MKIIINGKERLTDKETIENLLDSLGLKAAWTIVELNHVPVPRDRYGNQALAEGDRLEIVRAVAGG